MCKTKFLVMDVDGTLTDGKIYIGQEGDLAKGFSCKDGCGLGRLLPQLGIVPVIITARTSQIVENRCKELGITQIHQGVSDKLAKLKEVLAAYGADFGSVAYAGDDLPDMACMEAVKKAGGLVVCPGDAIPQIKQMADFVSGLQAGDGAIRDVIHFLMQRKEKKDVEQRVQQAISLLLAEDLTHKPVGEYTLADGTPYAVLSYETKAESQCVLETHRNHIDIQYMIAGCEQFKIYTTNCLTATGDYNAEKDVEFWQGGIEATTNLFRPGSLLVIYQGQPHKGSIQFGQPGPVKKVVCKIDCRD